MDEASAPVATMANDPHSWFHETWLGMVQPVEGLVVSIPVLVEAQCMERLGPELQARFRALCPLVDAETGAELDEDEDAARGLSRKERGELERRRRAASRRYRDLRTFLAELLGWSTDLYDVGDALPADLSRYIAEGHQTIRPTLALRKLDGTDAALSPVSATESADADREGDDADDETDDETDDEADDEAATTAAPRARTLAGLPDIETPESLAGKPYVALVWELPAGLDFDKPETETGAWKYPPAAKFDRLLRACRVPIGLLCNGEAIRLVYAPHGEATGAITFDLTDMGTVDGRPILDAFVMLLSAQRLFGVRVADALPSLLRRSRERQANVTNALAAQVFEALDILLRGFEAAAHRDRHAQLRALLALARGDDGDGRGADDHLYGGLLTVLLRLVFVLYAEDRELLPTDHVTYARHFSLGQLFEDLQRDHAAFPDTMNRRFGAWSRLLALFRIIHDGADHGTLQIPRRRGELFDPSRFPFLESWQLPNVPVAKIPSDMADVQVPSIDDETVYRVLERLVILEGQRLSYKVLDVEQIGSVYEALMGYGVVSLSSAAVCCRHKSLQSGSSGGVWIDAATVLAQKPADRSKFLVETYDVVKGDAKKIAAELKAAKTEAAILDALERISLKKVARRSPGQLALQPGEERRRTSSHYTPRSLSQPIVRRTLEPLLRAMSPTATPSSQQILSLKICDPAMGSGAFLVEACRFIADHLVAAWEREGQIDKIASAKEDVVTHARRLVVQTCLYGVDKNPFAVSLAKLSLWLVTLAKEEPFTFVDHALRHGDSLIGLTLDQIQAFHWAPDGQIDVIEKEIASCIAESTVLRQQIIDLAAASSPGVTRLKEQILWDADDALERARLVGDLIVGAFFFDGDAKERDRERLRRRDLVAAWLTDGGPPTNELTRLANDVRIRHPVFHWHLEFPEIFQAARPDPLEGGVVNRVAHMDSFIGNPPYAGVNSLSRSYGLSMKSWLWETFPGDKGTRGNVDLAVFFILHCIRMLGKSGTVGFVTTKSVSQGDSRVAGLAVLLSGHRAMIYDSTRNVKWPGAASVTVCTIHLAVGSAAVAANRSGVFLDGARVDVVNSRLKPKPERPDPVPLEVNKGRAFQGTVILGMGFTLSHEEKQELCQRNVKNKQRIFPYIGGQDVSSSPTQEAGRYVINFEDMDLVQASTWRDLIEIVRARVKPERDKLKGNAIALQRKKYWWQFAGRAPNLYEAICGQTRCLVTLRVKKHSFFCLLPVNQVFANTLYVIAYDRYAHFALFQSRVHELWSVFNSSTLEERLTYSASDCFENFPLPNADPESLGSELDRVGEALHETRKTFTRARGLGLTDTYNLLKSAQCKDPDVIRLRSLHEDVDRAVLNAYGWSDIEVPPYGDPVSADDWAAREAFDDEVIDRLFALNAERAAEEQLLGVAAGNGTAKSRSKIPAKRRGKQSAAAQLSLEEDA